MCDLVHKPDGGDRRERGRGEGVAGQSSDVVWGMLYVDDAGVVPKSTEGLARMMTFIVEVSRKFALTVSGDGDGDGDPGYIYV
eukprot:g7588.t1